MFSEINDAQLKEIVLKEDIVDIGQLAKHQIYILNRWVKKGLIAKGKGGPFPRIKTVYAPLDYNFEIARKNEFKKLMALSICKRV